MNQEDLTTLENYYLNSLDEDERQKVEQRIASDDDFSLLAEDVKILIAGVQRFEEDSLRRKMQDWDNISGRPKISRRLPHKYFTWMAVAAAVVVILTTTLILNNDLDTDILFKQYYDLPTAPTISLRGENELISLKKSGFEAFNIENYSEALAFFNDYLEQENDREVRFYYALSLFEVGESSQAIQQMKFLYNQHFDPVYQWYLALFYLNSGDTEEAESLLINLQKSPEFSQNATELLKHLE